MIGGWALMTKSELPRRFAIAGGAVAFAFAGMWWFINRHGFLLAGPGGSPSEVRQILDGITLVLCPGELLGVFASDMQGWAFPTVIWVIAAGLNAFLYYWVGRAIAATARRRSPGSSNGHQVARTKSRLPKALGGSAGLLVLLYFVLSYWVRGSWSVLLAGHPDGLRLLGPILVGWLLFAGAAAAIFYGVGVVVAAVRRQTHSGS